MLKLSFLLLLCLLPNYLSGQDAAPRDKADDDMQDMPGMSAHSFIQFLEQRETAGTDAEPNSTPTPMIMTSKGGWMLMFHAVGFLADIQQTGPRGGDKFFSTNWTMPMAQRRLGPGTLTIRSMLSLEPATITDRRYPELFQQGETAYGRPIVDGQHPHDLFMELAAMYDYRIGENTMLSLYAAPVGGPALGPIAFPHRSSAAENPMATLGHHLEDSTHISDDVVTLGLTYRNVRVEGSGFHGREPDEFRWNIDQGKIDSWSSRVTVSVRQNWSMQYSIGHLHSPEELSPKEDIERMTASVMYNRPLRRGNWVSTLAWGRNGNLSSGNVGNGYLLESTLGFAGKNNVWMRIENVDRTNELLLDGGTLPTGFDERYFARVQGYTAGYDREVGHLRHLSTAIGGQFTWYGVPPSLSTDYGKHPVGGIVFLRVRVR